MSVPVALPRWARIALATSVAVNMGGAFASATAQHLRRTDDISQAALIERGLSAETTCRGEQPPPTDAAGRGGLAPLKDLGRAPAPPVSIAMSAGGVSARRIDTPDTSSWRVGLLQLRVHGRHTGCHFDWRARAAGSTPRRIAADAIAVGSLPGALGGALHLFGGASGASGLSASEALDTPRDAELGVAYTSLNLYRALLPWLYANAAFDLRVRLSAAASFAYGEARRLRDQDVVPDLSAIVVGKIEEKLHGGIFYSAHVIPNDLPGSRLTEHTVTLMHGFRSAGGPSGWLMMRSPYGTVRYSRWHLGSVHRDRELALTAGLTLF